ncbi:MAG: alpha-galactosidase [Chloroflexi bacterium]|nr:alpha-galactosidase [Chloroflexota bacterium]
MPTDQQPDSWVLHTENTTYAVGLNAAGQLVTRYWGRRLDRVEDIPPAQDLGRWASFSDRGTLNQLEYPAYAGPNYVEPALKITQPDGVRDTVLKFESADCEEGLLEVVFRDVHYPLKVSINYWAHFGFDLIERWVEVRNEGDEPMVIERAYSAVWNVPRGPQYRLRHLTGKWLDEWQMQSERLTPGVKLLESRRLTTSHHHNPWWSLDVDADEEHGDVWFGTLLWSGNWATRAEVTGFYATRVATGINDWDFAYRLDSGRSFETAHAWGGYTSKGYTGASHCLHDHAGEYLMPDRDRRWDHPKPVLFNSWEVSTFDVDTESQTRYAEIAADLGVELFVMDDGWFKGRTIDKAGLGDWTPDPVKFPDGLSPLAERVKALGMTFGLWIEPEMVNPDSDLYRNHPDWIIHFPTRTPSEMRDQYILNLARLDVQDYLIAELDTLLKSADIRFIKWDMNRNVSEPGWPDAPGDPREIWVEYVKGLYRVLEQLGWRHPNIVWQSCSGGGGRADYGILKYAEQIWISDNTMPTRRLPMQVNYLHAFPASTMEAWVTDMGDPIVPLSFRLHVSMFGVFGIGADITKWGDAEKDMARTAIAQYKQIRHIVHNGRVYRLQTPEGYTALNFVDYDTQHLPSEAVIFAFRTHIPDPAVPLTVYPRGLEPDRLYTLETLELPHADTGGHGFDSDLRAALDLREGVRTGAGWMYGGIPLLLGNFDSRVLRLKAVEEGNSE